MQYKDINYIEPKFNVDINFTSKELKDLLIAYEELTRAKEYSNREMEQSFHTFYNLRSMINTIGVKIN